MALFSIHGLPTSDHHDLYERERTIEIDTAAQVPRDLSYEQEIVDDNDPYWNKHEFAHFHKFIMIKYVVNMVEQALCLLQNSQDSYTLDPIGRGVHGCTFMLIRNGVKRAIKFQIFNDDFLLEQKTMVKFQQVKPEIAVKMDKYCFVWFPQEQFHVAIMQMDLIDGTLYKLLSEPTMTKEIVYNMGHQILTIFDAMKKYKLNHCDMHLDNIAYRKISEGVYKILLIDFGWGSHSKHFDSISELSFLRAVVALSDKKPGRSFMRKFIFSNIDKLLSPGDRFLVSDADYPESINFDNLSDLYLERLRGDYYDYKLKLIEHTIDKQLNKLVLSEHGTPGPLRKYLPTRSKSNQHRTNNPPFSCPNGECSPVTSSNEQ
jgi:hypothetical protein